jgi:hypothetical protein
VSGRRGRSSKQIWRSTTTSTTTYIHARSRSPGRVLRGRRCDGDSSTQNAPDGPRSPARGSPGASTTQHRCTQPLLGGPDRPRTIRHHPGRQYTANETGACLGWIVDWRNARPCLVGVAVGNLPAGKGRAESKQRNRIDQQGCSAALGLGMQARCASMQAAACGPNRPTQIYKAADEGNARKQATAISLCQPGPPLGEATSLRDTVVATTVT